MVRAALEALTRGDVDSAFKDAAPDATIDLSRAVGLDRGVYTVPEFRGVTEEFGAIWESVRYEVDEIIEGGNYVVTPFRNQLVGRDGIAIEARRDLALGIPRHDDRPVVPLSGAARGPRSRRAVGVERL